MTPDRGSQMETQAPDTARVVETAEYLGFMYEDIGNEMIALARERDAQSAQIATLQAEVERLREERKAADHRLVDRYRNPTTGMFSFPDDVAAIILALDKAETDRNAAISRAEAAEARKGEADE